MACVVATLHQHLHTHALLTDNTIYGTLTPQSHDIPYHRKVAIFGITNFQNKSHTGNTHLSLE